MLFTVQVQKAAMGRTKCAGGLDVAHWP